MGRGWTTHLRKADPVVGQNDICPDGAGVTAQVPVSPNGRVRL